MQKAVAKLLESADFLDEVDKSLVTLQSMSVSQAMQSRNRSEELRLVCQHAV